MDEVPSQEPQSGDAPRSATAEAIYAKRAEGKRALRRSISIALVVATVMWVIMWFSPAIHFLSILFVFLGLGLVGLLGIMQLAWGLFPKGSLWPFAVCIACVFVGAAFVLPAIDDMQLERRKSDAVGALATLDAMRNDQGLYPREEEVRTVLPDGVRYIRSHGDTEVGIPPGRGFSLYARSRFGFMSGYVLTSDDRTWQYWD